MKKTRSVRSLTYKLRKRDYIKYLPDIQISMWAAKDRSKKSLYLIIVLIVKIAMCMNFINIEFNLKFNNILSMFNSLRAKAQ